MLLFYYQYFSFVFVLTLCSLLNSKMNSHTNILDSNSNSVIEQITQLTISDSYDLLVFLDLQPFSQYIKKSECIKYMKKIITNFISDDNDCKNNNYKRDKICKWIESRKQDKKEESDKKKEERKKDKKKEERKKDKRKNNESKQIAIEYMKELSIYKKLFKNMLQETITNQIIPLVSNYSNYRRFKHDEEQIQKLYYMRFVSQINDDIILEPISDVKFDCSYLHNRNYTSLDIVFSPGNKKSRTSSQDNTDNKSTKSNRNKNIDHKRFTIIKTKLRNDDKYSSTNIQLNFSPIGIRAQDWYSDLIDKKRKSGIYWMCPLECKPNTCRIAPISKNLCLHVSSVHWVFLHNLQNRIYLPFEISRVCLEYVNVVDEYDVHNIQSL